MVGYTGLKENSTKITERDNKNFKIAFKTSIYFTPLIIEFFCFA